MEGIIEAVLFTMGDSVEAGKLADAIEQDVDTTVKIVHNLMDKYESENRGNKNLLNLRTASSCVPSRNIMMHL